MGQAVTQKSDCQNRIFCRPDGLINKAMKAKLELQNRNTKYKRAHPPSVWKYASSTTDSKTYSAYAHMPHRYMKMTNDKYFATLPITIKTQ